MKQEVDLKYSVSLSIGDLFTNHCLLSKKVLFLRCPLMSKVSLKLKVYLLISNIYTKMCGKVGAHKEFSSIQII
jgi:hypothetical protein